MHKQRRHIVLRWVASLLIVLGMAGYLGFSAGEQLLQQDRTRPSKPKKIPLPSKKETQTLRDTIVAMHTIPAESTTRKRPVPELMVESKPQALAQQNTGNNVEETQTNKVSVSLIMIGPVKRFAVLNGRAYEEGAFLGDGRMIAQIKPDGVVLELEGQEDFLAWSPPQRVQIIKAAPVAAQVQAGDATPDQTEEAAAAAQPVSQEEALEKAKEALKQ